MTDDASTILGICAYHGDASAALVEDGEVLAAAEEERYRRVKHWAGFPSEAIRSCLEVADREPEDVDRFAIGREPNAHFWKKVKFTLLKRPDPRFVLERLRNHGEVRDVGEALAETLDLPSSYVDDRTRRVEHHPAHLASTFYVSPFDEAAVAAIDGFGDFVSTSQAHGRGANLDVLDRVHYPHSIGVLYQAITQFLGFTRYGSEYKVMGLASYGDPTYADEIRELAPLEDDGSFRLELEYFDHWRRSTDGNWDGGRPEIGQVYNEALADHLGPARDPDDPITERHQDLAASVQHVFEQTLFHVLEDLHDRTGLHRLCLAGGTALNSVANGKIRAETPFEEVYIQPAAGDNGTALGAAYHVWHDDLDGDRGFVMDHAFWGPEYDHGDVEAALDERKADLQASGCTIEWVEETDALCDRVAGRIADGDVVGWFRGPMEWGPRALGNRSILADPRRADIRDVINKKVKYREEFRPFAPSVLEEAVDDYFEGAAPDPFMIHVYPVREEKRDEIPAVTHVDGTGRIQSVSRDRNPVYWDLIKAFEERTGVPVVLNTSFNENEPIVNRPEEALDCFLRTDMDVLAMEDAYVEKGGR